MITLEELAPPPDLRGQLLRAVRFSERSAPLRRLEAPLLGVVLIVSTGPDLEVDGGWIGSFAAGLYDRPVVTGHGGEQAGTQLYLSPLAARAALRVPMVELTNRTVSLDDLGLDDETAIATVMCRLRDAPPPRPELAYALGRLTAGAPVETVAAEVGWSRRHLATRFRDALGLPPRTITRLARATRAARLLEAGACLADVGYECGYADQPHFTREFKAFAGVTPGRFPNVQDTAVAA